MLSGGMLTVPSRIAVVRSLRTGLGLACLAGAAACGSTSAAPTSSPDASHGHDAVAGHDAGHNTDAAAGHDAGHHADAGHDAGHHADATGSQDAGGGEDAPMSMLGCSGGCSNGIGCAPGCTVSEKCTTEGNVCSCTCPDAGPVRLCTPSHDAGCSGYYLPESCFDAAIPPEPTVSECQALCGDQSIAACGPTLPGGTPGILCEMCLSQ